jgi:hypothetical protein
MPCRPLLTDALALKTAPQLGYFTRSSICIAISIRSQNHLGDVFDGYKLNQSFELDEIPLTGWKRKSFGAIPRVRA